MTVRRPPRPLTPIEFDPVAATRWRELPVADEPHLWLVPVQDHMRVAMQLASQLLDDQERQRADSFRRAVDRDTYRVAHVALRLVLGGYLQVPPVQVRTTREPCRSCGGAHGRPVLAEGSGHFSLSRSGGLVLLAVSRKPVGVDVEVFPAVETVRDVAAQLHPREIAYLRSLPDVELTSAFTRVWVRKEAYLKGLGIGMSRAPSMDFVGSGTNGEDGPPGWSFHNVDVGVRSAAAVAVLDAEDGTS